MEIIFEGSSGWNDIPCDRSNRGQFVCKKSEKSKERPYIKKSLTSQKSLELKLLYIKAVRILLIRYQMIE